MLILALSQATMTTITIILVTNTNNNNNADKAYDTNNISWQTYAAKQEEHSLTVVRMKNQTSSSLIRKTPLPNQWAAARGHATSAD